MAANQSSMAHQNDPDRAFTPSGTDNRTDPSRASSEAAEEIYIRNYDHQWGYDLDLVVTTPDGDVVFRKRYYLQPGQTVSEHDPLPSADYEFHVTLDNSQEESRQCRVDSSLDHTAVIEVGNGVLSVTEGLQS
jgi:hypothetical protein